MENSIKKAEIDVKNKLKSNKNMSIVHIPEPEIIDDMFDLRIGKKNYRIFVNKTLKKIYCNEIISNDYKGVVLLKNPVNKEMSKELAKILFGANLPENEWLDTINDLRKQAKRKKQENKPKKISKVRGRKPKTNIISATLFCIQKHNFKTTKTFKPTLLRASKLFKTPEQDEVSFMNIVGGKWRNIRNQYRMLPKEIKDTKNQYQYAKETLRNPRNKRKQKL